MGRTYAEKLVWSASHVLSAGHVFISLLPGEIDLGPESS